MRALVLAGAAIADYSRLAARLSPVDLVVCADSGVRHAAPLGLKPHAVVGDFDSAGEAELERLRAAGIDVVRHPVDKDESDTELAIAYALHRGARRIDLAGAIGDRLDHSLSNLLLLPRLTESGVEVRVLDACNEVRYTRARIEIAGRAGDRVSLIPLTPEVEGVTTAGLRFPLRDEPLRWGSARGVSNVLLGDRATVQVRGGWLAVVRSDAD